MMIVNVKKPFVSGFTFFSRRHWPWNKWPIILHVGQNGLRVPFTTPLAWAKIRMTGHNRGVGYETIVWNFAGKLCLPGPPPFLRVHSLPTSLRLFTKLVPTLPQEYQTFWHIVPSISE